jgi:hypothetical protein
MTCLWCKAVRYITDLVYLITGYPPGSLWKDHLISRRVETAWGTHTLVEAVRNMMAEAFKDPLNQV